jgi:pimeloyl-ACP methyl ester carboxylesterase
MRLRPALVAAVVALMLSAACGGPAEPRASGSSQAVEPVAECVTPDEQRTNGIRVPVTGATTEDALVYGSGSVGLVLANQSDSDLCDWKVYAQAWAQRGYRILVFNYSTAPPDKDVLGAAAELRRRGSSRIFLIGASMGGTAVLAAAAAAQPPVAGVISLSGPTAYGGVDASTAVRKLTVPALFLVGESDGRFADDAKTLYAACPAKDKKLEILPTGSHGIGLIDERIDNRIQTFLTQH